MPGPHGAPDGGYAKPKNAKKRLIKCLNISEKANICFF